MRGVNGQGEYLLASPYYVISVRNKQQIAAGGGYGRLASDAEFGCRLPLAADLLGGLAI